MYAAHKLIKQGMDKNHQRNSTTLLEIIDKTVLVFRKLQS